MIPHGCFTVRRFCTISYGIRFSDTAILLCLPGIGGLFCMYSVVGYKTCIQAISKVSLLRHCFIAHHKLKLHDACPECAFAVADSLRK